VAKWLEIKLLLTAYEVIMIEKSIGSKINDLDLCKVMPTIASHSLFNISKTFRQRLGSKEPPIGNVIWGIKWSHDR